MAGRGLRNSGHTDSSGRISLGSSPSIHEDVDGDGSAVPPTPPRDLAGPSGCRPTSGIEVFVLGNKLGSRSKELPTILRTIHQARIHPDGWKYKYIPDSHKQTWWPVFKESAWWKPEIPESAIRHAFYNSMQDSYGARIYEWKAAYKNAKDPTDRPIPACVGVENWTRWLEHFNSPEEQEKSEKARANRLSEPGGPNTGIAKHRGGSRPANRQRDELALRNNGQPPSNYDILLSYHKKPDDSFTDPKAQSIAKEYEATLDQRLAASDQSSQIDPNEVYLEVVGNKKGRRYGLGCFGKAQHSSSSSTSSHSDVRHLQTLLESQQIEDAA